MQLGSAARVCLKARRGSIRLQANRKQSQPGAPVSAAFTVRLDESTLAALDDLAHKTDRPRNWLVAKAIEDYVALNAWQIGKIEAGLVAADRGDFASDAELALVRKKFAVQQ